ncbi:MAG TPA: heme exporter protein CcmB [Caulobacteraceae bacterium]|jgi:heme exporter protein B
MSPARVLAGREISLAWGKGGGPLLAVGFLAAAATLMPLALGPAPGPLAGVAAGVVWVVLALASLLGLEGLFERDLEDGALDLLALGPLPLEATCAIKCIASWLVTGAPLALAAPLAAIALGAPARSAPMVLVTAALGGLAFAFVGGLGAALALASRRGAALMAVIVLPLLIPPVVFAGAAIAAWSGGQPWGAALALLTAYVLAAAALSPLAMAAGCRNALG